MSIKRKDSQNKESYEETWKKSNIKIRVRSNIYNQNKQYLNTLKTHVYYLVEYIISLGLGHYLIGKKENISVRLS